MIKGNAFPLDDTDYTAEYLRKWFFTRTSGVFCTEDNLQVTANDNMSISVSTGMAYMNDGSGGIVAWNNFATQIQVPVADNMLDRIDTIVFRWDKKLNLTCLDLVKGDLAENPVPKAPVRDSNAYEIVLAQVHVSMGTGAITTDKITDTRLDESVCGLMRDGVTGIPTQALYDQFSAWFATVKKELDDKTFDMKHEFTAWFESIKGTLSEDPATALYDTLASEYYGVGTDTDEIIHGSTGAGKVAVGVFGNTIQKWMDLSKIAAVGKFDYGVGKKINGGVLAEPARACTNLCFPVQPNNEYTIECTDYHVEVYYATDDYTFISHIEPSWGYKVRTFTTPENCRYIRILMRKPDNTAIGTITGKLYISAVSEPSLNTPLLIESVGHTNLVDISQLPSAPLASECTGWGKIKIVLLNGLYTWSIEKNNFLGKAASAMLTNDPNFAGSISPNKYWYSWIGNGNVESSCAASRSFTASDGYAYLAFTGADLHQPQLIEFLPEFQIEKGDVRHSYIPYGKYGVDIKSCGKNMVNVSKLSTMPDDPAATGDKKKKITLPNGVYKFKILENKFFGTNMLAILTDDPDFRGTGRDGYFYEWIGNGSNVNMCRTEGTFTVTRGVVYLTYSGITDFISILPEFQIYESSQEDIQTIVLDEPLRAIGDTRDEIKDGKLIRRIGYLHVDGSTSGLAAYAPQGIATYAAISNLNIKAGEVLCDKLPYVEAWNLAVNPNCVHATDKLLIGLTPELTGCDDRDTGEAALSKFKALLNAIPLDILYVLKDPIIEDLPTVTIRSYPNHTTIQSTEEIHPMLHSDLNRHEAAIADIESTVSETKALKEQSVQFIQKGDFAIATGTLTIQKGQTMGAGTMEYPEGFDVSNSVVISLMASTTGVTDWKSVAVNGNMMFSIILRNKGILIDFYGPIQVTADTTQHIRAVFMKIS